MRPSSFGAGAVGDGGADGEVGEAGVAEEEGLEGGEQGHEQGDAFGWRERALEGVGEGGGQGAGLAAAAEAGGGGPGAVGGELEHGDAGELAAPVGELASRGRRPRSQSRCQTA